MSYQKEEEIFIVILIPYLLSVMSVLCFFYKQRYMEGIKI